MFRCKTLIRICCTEENKNIKLFIQKSLYNWLRTYWTMLLLIQSNDFNCIHVLDTTTFQNLSCTTDASKFMHLHSKWTLASWFWNILVLWGSVPKKRKVDFKNYMVARQPLKMHRTPLLLCLKTSLWQRNSFMLDTSMTFTCVSFCIHS